MNKWLKYGGIMPDIINTANIIMNRGKIINPQGEITNSQPYTVTDYIDVKGKYVEIKLINNSRIDYVGAIVRTNLYKDDTLLETITNIRFPSGYIDVNKIYKFKMNVENANRIKIAFRTTMPLLEIEQL